MISLVFGFHLMIGAEALTTLQCRGQSFNSVSFCESTADQVIRVSDAYVYDADGKSSDEPRCEWQNHGTDCQKRLEEVKLEEYQKLIDTCDGSQTCNYTVPRLLIKGCGYTNYMLIDYQCFEPVIFEETPRPTNDDHPITGHPEAHLGSTQTFIDGGGLDPDGDSSSGSMGVYIGISVGVLAAVIIAVILLIVYKRRTRSARETQPGFAEYSLVRNTSSTSMEVFETEIHDNANYETRDLHGDHAHFSSSTNQRGERYHSVNLVENPFYDTMENTTNDVMGSEQQSVLPCATDDDDTCIIDNENYDFVRS